MGIDRDTLRAIQALIAPITNRVINSIARGVVRLVDDTKKMQRVQVDGFPGGPADGAEHFQPYGFSSVPLEGAKAALLFLNGGDMAHPIVVAVADPRYRPVGGQGGEVTFYNFTGAKITMTKDGDIVAEPAPGRAYLIRAPGGTAVELATKADVAKIATAIAGATITPNDGGATLKATIAAGLASSLHGVAGTTTWPVGTTVLKGQ